MTLLAAIDTRNRKTRLHDKLFMAVVGLVAAISITTVNTAACIALLHV